MTSLSDVQGSGSHVDQPLAISPENATLHSRESGSRFAIVDNKKLDLILLKLAELQQLIEQRVVKPTHYDKLDFDDIGVPADSDENLRTLEEKLADKEMRSRLVRT